MNKIDTSAEAVERTADRIVLHSPPLAALLRALLAERDALQANVAQAERRGAEEMRERAAAACLRYAEQQAMEWRAGLKASSRLEALSDGADDCVDIIRALPLSGGDA